MHVDSSVTRQAVYCAWLFLIISYNHILYIITGWSIYMYDYTDLVNSIHISIMFDETLWGFNMTIDSTVV